MCFLQDDVVKFVSEPASPPRLVEIPDEGRGKAKVRHEVGEGDDTVFVEDTSDEDDEETLQERFQLRSRFSRPGLPHVPLVQDPPTSLEASFLRRQGSRATWPASAWPRSLRSRRPHLKR
jgi:hypothetical protein